ncbi:MAG: hypothetical protein ACJ768_13025 [Gaiellaceae bacterium]
MVVGVALLLLAGGTSNAVAAGRPSGTALTAPVTGTFTDALGGTGTFAGNLTVTRFVSQNGSLAATGTLTGTLTDSVGTVLGTVSQQITLPAVITQATCQILHLELGPLDLNLLGLRVHLDKVVLDITAQQGPGNLLGNLLCAIAHLLDHGSLTGLLNVLNQILALLG